MHITVNTPQQTLAFWNQRQRLLQQVRISETENCIKDDYNEYNLSQSWLKAKRQWWILQETSKHEIKSILVDKFWNPHIVFHKTRFPCVENTL